MSLTVSVDVKQHWTMLRHWSQFVPNMSTEDTKLYFINILEKPTWRLSESRRLIKSFVVWWVLLFLENMSFDIQKSGATGWDDQKAVVAELLIGAWPRQWQTWSTWSGLCCLSKWFQATMVHGVGGWGGGGIVQCCSVALCSLCVVVSVSGSRQRWVVVGGIVQCGSVSVVVPSNYSFAPSFLIRSPLIGWTSSGALVQSGVSQEGVCWHCWHRSFSSWADFVPSHSSRNRRKYHVCHTACPDLS